MELQIEDKLIKVIKFTEGNICDRCLGRNFSKSVAGSGNLERGEYLKK